MKKAMVIHPHDNVASLLAEVEKGESVSIERGTDISEFKVRQKIGFGHKFALRRILKGEDVVKYGEVIGRATQDIEEGCHVHVHNVESLRGRGDVSELPSGHGSPDKGFAE
jgi:altronate dehydratase small subunit